MTLLPPTSVDEAVDALADPEIQVLAGGTDFMVEVNAGHRRPEKVLSLHHVPELGTWRHVPAADGQACTWLRSWVRVPQRSPTDRPTEAAGHLRW